MQSPTIFSNSFDIYYLSEKAVTIEFGNEIDADILKQINRLYILLKQYPFNGFCTAVPAYTTLTVFYDPLQVAKAPDLYGNTGFEKVSGYIKQLQASKFKTTDRTNAVVTIPVCYGGRYGPDLEEVAIHNKLTTQEVVSLHSSAIYKVYMIGFVPGFAYMGGLPEQLATPRKATPRAAIPAGSVGIAGKQTGIYPLQTPGGWQLIGRTPLNLFDPNLREPALLKAGDEVTFKPINSTDFDLYQNHADTHH
nr:Allophanate hydrolase subunit 1 [uncultured organism]